MSNFHLLKNHIQRIILQTFLIQPQPSDKQTRKCEMCIILKQIKIFKSPTMTEWIKRAPLWRYDRGQNTQLINRKKRRAIQRVIYPVSTRGLAQFTPSDTSNCCSSSQSFFIWASFSLFSAPWKSQGCHDSYSQEEGSGKMLTTPCFSFLARCKARCPLCLHRHYVLLCYK